MAEVAVAGEGDEVEVAGQLIPDEAPWHGAMVHPVSAEFRGGTPTSLRDVGHPANPTLQALRERPIDLCAVRMNRCRL